MDCGDGCSGDIIRDMVGGCGCAVCVWRDFVALTLEVVA